MSDRLTIVRRGKPPGFQYADEGGRKITNPDILGRIRALAIPPAWRDVRIADSERAKLQAVGTDARGRKQYRYAKGFREKRELEKFSRMPAFARALPLIRKRARRDLARPGLPREKVLAAVVLILDQTFIRIGSDEYARDNGSFGLTTLEDRHARPQGGKLTFDFKGKSGVRHAIDLEEPELVRVVRACRDLPGSQLFQYVDESGAVHDVKAHHVNEYLKDVTGKEFTAKDFRTWAGTALACALLRKCDRGGCKSPTGLKRIVAGVVKEVAGHLRNTPAVCRKSYIAPAVIDAFIAGTLEAGGQRVRQGRTGRLSAQDERIVRQLLRAE